jgi:hypothetical protein
VAGQLPGYTDERLTSVERYPPLAERDCHRAIMVERVNGAPGGL